MSEIILRPIRSFVLRSGRITTAQQRNLDSLWSYYGVEISTAILNWDVIFGRNAPLWVEIGFGNGDFLVHLAQQHPEVNLLGIEVHRPGIGNLLGKVQNSGITNVRVCCADAIEVVRNCLAPRIVQRAYILFPDPWPKKRHQKRRLIQHPFISELGERFAPGGQLHLATDWEDYARQISAVISTAPGWRNLNEADKISHPTRALVTRFEDRGKNLGHRIWNFSFLRE